MAAASMSKARAMTSAAFNTFIAAEIEKWRKVIKFAAIKPL